MGELVSARSLMEFSRYAADIDFCRHLRKCIEKRDKEELQHRLTDKLRELTEEKDTPLKQVLDHLNWMLAGFHYTIYSIGNWCRVVHYKGGEENYEKHYVDQYSAPAREYYREIYDKAPQNMILFLQYLNTPCLLQFGGKPPQENFEIPSLYVPTGTWKLMQRITRDRSYYAFVLDIGDFDPLKLLNQDEKKQIQDLRDKFAQMCALDVTPKDPRDFIRLFTFSLHSTIQLDLDKSLSGHQPRTNGVHVVIFSVGEPPAGDIKIHKPEQGEETSKFAFATCGISLLKRPTSDHIHALQALFNVLIHHAVSQEVLTTHGGAGGMLVVTENLIRLCSRISEEILNEVDDYRKKVGSLLSRHGHFVETDRADPDVKDLMRILLAKVEKFLTL